MDQAEWRTFLKQYSQELLSHDWSNTIRLFSSRGAVISDHARRAKWMGFDPAPESAIAAAEQRLGCRLPPSLRTFYEVSNGWGMTGAFIFDILPVEKIGWLKDLRPHLYELACRSEERRNGRPFKNDPDGSRLAEYCMEQGTSVKRSLAISSWGDAVIWLLDPGAAPNDGEWPGGRWASWGPGMHWSSKSFEDLMRREFEAVAEKPYS